MYNHSFYEVKCSIRRLTHTVFYEVKTFEVYESQERTKAFT
ncbi:hypothetical protein [Staphylococcus chromogenes]|nr:hypothetical protein [Staphylococcus chromogenes]MDU0451850.1 hypothetical protein [Staphylococcus chromogenes]